MTQEIFVRLLRTTGWAFLASLVLYVLALGCMPGSPLLPWMAVGIALLASIYAVLGDSISCGAHKLLRGSNVNMLGHLLFSDVAGVSSLMLIALSGFFAADGWVCWAVLAAVFVLQALGSLYLGRAIEASCNSAGG